ncbi:MAG: hypothetical protein AUH36_01255 [Chloroflexi bacterium 13_1_40CM_55_7]|nr:MAG: hypothetical protein AUH36_01255 [Chloroflexi bacterium 13_1_40CM_55_7]
MFRLDSHLRLFCGREGTLQFFEHGRTHHSLPPIYPLGKDHDSREAISYGRFCWNEECQYCRISFDLGDESASRAAISCKLMVQDGMRINGLTSEIRYGLRTLDLPKADE